MSSIRTAADHNNLMLLFHKAHEGGLGSEISYNVFQNFPANLKRSFSECQVESVSRWSLDLLLDRCEARVR